LATALRLTTTIPPALHKVKLVFLGVLLAMSVIGVVAAAIKQK
jgi:hypothetical protein